MKILVINSGSSSLKFQVIDMSTEQVLAPLPRWQTMVFTRRRSCPMNSAASAMGEDGVMG